MDASRPLFEDRRQKPARRKGPIWKASDRTPLQQGNLNLGNRISGRVNFSNGGPKKTTLLAWCMYGLPDESSFSLPANSGAQTNGVSNGIPKCVCQLLVLDEDRFSGAILDYISILIADTWVVCPNSLMMISRRFAG